MAKRLSWSKLAPLPLFYVFCAIIPLQMVMRINQHNPAKTFFEDVFNENAEEKIEDYTNFDHTNRL